MTDGTWHDGESTNNRKYTRRLQLCDACDLSTYETVRVSLVFDISAPLFHGVQQVQRFSRPLHKNVASARRLSSNFLFPGGGQRGASFDSSPLEVACFHTLPGHRHINDPLLSILPLSLSWNRVNDMLRFSRSFFSFTDSNFLQLS